MTSEPENERYKRLHPADGLIFERWLATRIKDQPQISDEQCVAAARRFFRGVSVQRVRQVREILEAKAGEQRAKPQPRRSTGPEQSYTRYVQEAAGGTAQRPSAQLQEPCPACEMRPDMSGNCRCG